MSAVLRSLPALCALLVAACAEHPAAEPEAYDILLAWGQAWDANPKTYDILVARGQAWDANPKTYDILIVGGTVYDGSGGPERRSRIGIRGDRIATMDAPAGAAAERTVDASGLIVMPGFVDPHTHAVLWASLGKPAANVNYLMQGVTTVFVGSDGRGVPDRERTLAALERHGSGVNVAFLAGHGQARREVLGMQDRAPTAAELETMLNHVRTEMKAGAYGLSTGLYYAPGSYSDTDEVVALAAAAAELGGIYDTHLRDEGSNTVGLLPAVDEAIRIARDADIPVHISHIKALGPAVWGSSSEVIAKVEAARAEGLEITANQYPWLASGTRFSSTLIPRWAMADDVETRGPDYAARLRAGVEANLERRGGADAMRITAGDSPYRGMTLAAAAEALGVDAASAALRLIADGDPSIASFAMHADDAAAFARQPWVMTGSDGSSGHPRLYASYPKAWQDLVVPGTVSPAAFARRSAGLVAETFRLCDRGLLREGYVADIVVIDPDRYEPTATYERPAELATGVEALVVNGELVIEDATLQNTSAGRVLRKTRATCSD